MFADEKEWEVRHGGLLGLKYLLAVRGASVDRDLLAQLFPRIHSGLTDPSDDVISVAASALLPVVPLLISQLAGGGQVGQLATTLWTALLDLDDLTCSSHAILVLLSDLLSAPAFPFPLPLLFCGATGQPTSPHYSHGAAHRPLAAFLHHDPAAPGLPACTSRAQ